jgi:hypothetical protein
MSKTINAQSKSQQTLAARTRFTFGRSFLAALQSGVGHADTGKLSAFLVAAGAATPASLQKMADTGKLTRQVLNDVAVGIVALTPADQLPKNLNLA